MDYGLASAPRPLWHSPAERGPAFRGQYRFYASQSAERLRVLHRALLGCETTTLTWSRGTNRCSASG